MARRRRYRRNANLSYSARKRMTMDYRAEYFRHNPGLFGCMWTCAYCHAPLLGVHNVVVDHIMPLNSPLGRNSRFNLVASCRRCNLEKSDNVDYRVAQGYISKVFQNILFTIQKIFVVCLAGVLWVATKAINILFQGFMRLPVMMKIVIILAIIIFFFGR